MRCSCSISNNTTNKCDSRSYYIESIKCVRAEFLAEMELNVYCVVVMDKARPLVLLEVLQKAFWAIMTARMTAVWQDKNYFIRFTLVSGEVIQ